MLVLSLHLSFRMSLHSLQFASLLGGTKHTAVVKTQHTKGALGKINHTCGLQVEGIQPCFAKGNKCTPNNFTAVISSLSHLLSFT